MPKGDGKNGLLSMTGKKGEKDVTVTYQKKQGCDCRHTCCDYVEELKEELFFVCKKKKENALKGLEM